MVRPILLAAMSTKAADAPAVLQTTAPSSTRFVAKHPPSLHKPEFARSWLSEMGVVLCPQEVQLGVEAFVRGHAARWGVWEPEPPE